MREQSVRAREDGWMGWDKVDDLTWSFLVSPSHSCPSLSSLLLLVFVFVFVFVSGFFFYQWAKENRPTSLFVAVLSSPLVIVLGGKRKKRIECFWTTPSLSWKSTFSSFAHRPIHCLFWPFFPNAHNIFFCFYRFPYFFPESIQGLNRKKKEGVKEGWKGFLFSLIWTACFCSKERTNEGRKGRSRTRRLTQLLR